MMQAAQTRQQSTPVQLRTNQVQSPFHTAEYHAPSDRLPTPVGPAVTTGLISFMLIDQCNKPNTVALTDHNKYDYGVGLSKQS